MLNTIALSPRARLQIAADTAPDDPLAVRTSDSRILLEEMSSEQKAARE